MEINERIDYLINNLEAGRAKKFAEKVGMAEPALSKIRKGLFKPSGYYDRILAAYPMVNRDWLVYGTGYPGDLNIQMLSRRMQDVIDSKDRIIEKLSDEIARQGRIIDSLTAK